MKTRRLAGLQDYTATWHAMQEFTDSRRSDTADEAWLLQHAPVFTLGQAGKAEHLLARSDIPVIHSDRGGQITYHGPGQLIAYLLIDLKRRHLGVRDLVVLMEQSLIATLQHYGIAAHAKKLAPGVYVYKGQREHKIASLGLRVRKGCSYHGLALNIDVDLAPFAQINPCGHAGLAVTRLADLVSPPPAWADVENILLAELQKRLH